MTTSWLWSGPRKARETGPSDPPRVRLFALLSPRSLRMRLVLVVLAIDALTTALTGAVILIQARSATRLEIASSMQLAELVVADTIRLLRDAPAPVLLRSIDLHFQQVRHVRIVVVDAEGRLVEAHVDAQNQVSRANIAPQANTAPDAPEWFARLASPQIEHKDFPVVVQGQQLGVVSIRSNPDDEVGEAWNYAHGLFVTLLLLNIPVLTVLFFLFGRVLAPLSRLGSGLQKIQNKNYAVRLPPPSLLELAVITDTFNGMAESLAASQDANRRLNRELLTAQDDERRRTALELHDEVGPCLFALEANATSIVNITRASADSRLRERAEDVVALVGRAQEINRRVLDRLRPMSLGQIPLRELLERLLVDFEYAEVAPAIDPRIDTPRATYGQLVDLTIYRCAQEGVTNAVKHACATAISVKLDQIGDGPGASLWLRIEDDGRGMSDLARAGRGLAGMRERVEALTGTFDLRSTSSGTLLSIVLPVVSDDSPAAFATPSLGDHPRLTV